MPEFQILNKKKFTSNNIRQLFLVLFCMKHWRQIWGQWQKTRSCYGNGRSGIKVNKPVIKARNAIEAQTIASSLEIEDFVFECTDKRK